MNEIETDLIKFINNENCVIIANDDKIVSNLDILEIKTILIDDINFLNSKFLSKFFTSSKNVYVFINNIMDEKSFNSISTHSLLSYFNAINKIYNSILYHKRDFKHKKFLKKVSKYGDINNVCIEDINNILYIGQTGTSGYASATKGYVADYVMRGNNIKWIPLKFDDSKNDNNYYVDLVAESATRKEVDKFDFSILHTTPDLWRSYKNKYKKILSEKIVGYTVWETNLLPKKWVENINLLDEVWVPSKFNEEVFLDSGVRSKLKIVPHVYHPENLIDKNKIKLFDYFGNEIPNDKYTFYSIGEYHTRKGIDDTIKVFDRLYESNKNIQLVLKLHFRNHGEIENVLYIINSIKKLTNNLNKSIYIILDNLSRNQIVALHSFCDCYVSLNKGEAFGLTVFDANNFKKPLITTKYGGPLDFVDNEKMVNCKIEKVKGMESFSKIYTEEQSWAYPDLDDAFDKMKLYINK